MTGSQRLAAAVGKEEELTTWSRSICHLKSHPWNLKWLEKFKKFSAWDNFWGSWWDEMLLYLLLRPPLSADLEIMTRLTTSPLCSSPPPLLLCSLVSLFVRQQRRIIHHYKQLLRSRSGPSPNPTSALKILNIIEYTGFVHICQVWLLFELRLSILVSFDEFVALTVNFGVLCGNIFNYFV